jgi:uncharacterized membrane protein
MPILKDAKPVKQTAIEMLADDVLAVGKDLEKLSHLLREMQQNNVSVRYSDTAQKGVTHLQSFAKEIRRAIAEGFDADQKSAKIKPHLR